jgi:hypothetical protein
MPVVTAQVSLHPLHQEHLTPATKALRSAFERAAEAGWVVMTVTISNACPVAR